MPPKRSRRVEKASRPRKRSILLVSTLVIVVLIGSVSFALFYRTPPGEAKAAIIDQLASSQLYSFSRDPDPEFVQNSTNLLKTLFPTVDYYSDNATVEEYQKLPSQGYQLIIWRAHSALNEASKYVAISTSQKYHPGEYDTYLQNGELTLWNMSTTDPYLYIAITPTFVRDVMNGNFQNTVIILMSCNGLKDGYLSMAAALVNKGARAFISWDGWIPSEDNDRAVASLLQELIGHESSINLATAIAQLQVSNSPHLRYYPLDTGEYRLLDIVQTGVSTGVNLIPSAIVRKSVLSKVASN